MDERYRLVDDDETAYREQATALLDEFAEQARGVLRNAGIGIDLIFVVPPSGDVILTFSAAVELYIEEWKVIKATVSSLVRRAIGLEPAQCRDVVCAMAHSGDPASGSSVLWSDPRRHYGMICVAGLSRLLDIDRQTLMTVPGATPYLFAVGLMPLPAATHAQIRSRMAGGTFGRPIVLPAANALAWPARIARDSFVRRNSSITSSRVNGVPRLVSIPSVNRNSPTP
jgi:hypothetical protein